MSLLELAIGWLAPPECVNCGHEGTSLCEGCQLTEIIPFGERCYLCNKLTQDSLTCPTCRPSSPTHVWITTDYEHVAKDLVRKLKFAHQRAAAGPLAMLMYTTLQDAMGQDWNNKKNYLVMPVPTATSRMRQRSFDHTALLASFVARYLGANKAFTLKRLGQTRQVGAKRDVRKAQAHDNYYVLRPKLIKGKNILLIDDVVTTGATLRAAARILRKAGANSVDALIFAKRL